MSHTNQKSCDTIASFTFTQGQVLFLQQFPLKGGGETPSAHGRLLVELGRRNFQQLLLSARVQGDELGWLGNLATYKHRVSFR